MPIYFLVVAPMDKEGLLLLMGALLAVLEPRSVGCAGDVGAVAILSLVQVDLYVVYFEGVRVELSKLQRVVVKKR